MMDGKNSAAHRQTCTLVLLGWREIVRRVPFFVYLSGRAGHAGRCTVDVPLAHSRVLLLLLTRAARDRKRELEYEVNRG